MQKLYKIENKVEVRYLSDAVAIETENLEAVLSQWLTVVWNDAPGHGRCIDAPSHPEDAQPAKVFTSFLP